MPRPHPALNIVIPASRYIGCLSEEYMTEYSSGTRIHSGFLEFLLQQNGVPIETGLQLCYSMQTAIADSPALFSVKVLAASPDEIDPYYGTIMQVLKPYLHCQ